MFSCFPSKQTCPARSDFPSPCCDLLHCSVLSYHYILSHRTSCSQHRLPSHNNTSPHTIISTHTMASPHTITSPYSNTFSLVITSSHTTTFPHTTPSSSSSRLAYSFRSRSSRSLGGLHIPRAAASIIRPTVLRNACGLDLRRRSAIASSSTYLHGVERVKHKT